jgi:hypothetical protein
MASSQRLYLGRLPFDVDSLDLIAALTLEFAPISALITINPFGPKQKKKRGCEHKLHPGFGYAEVEGEVDIQLVMQRLRKVEFLVGKEVSLVAELANQTVAAVAPVPSQSSSSNNKNTGEGKGISTEENKNKRLEQRQHKKRQRARSNTRRNGLLISLLAQIPAPGGR